MIKTKQPRHFAWVILGCCCLIQGSTLGMVFNSSGIYFSAICRDLNFQIGDLSFYLSIQGVMTCLMLPVVTVLLNRFSIKIVLSSACCLLFCTVMGMSFCSQIIHWYILGFFQGIALAFLMTVPIGLTLANWFKKGLGIAMGLSASCSGIMGIIMNFIVSNIIVHYGWRVAYRLNAIIVFVLILPVTALVICFKPEEKGLLPYGEENIVSNQIDNFHPTQASPLPIKIFLLTIVMGIFGQMSISFYSHIAMLGVSKGMVQVVAASLTSTALVGNTLSKIAFGYISDKIGVQVSMLLCLVNAVISFTLFRFCKGYLLFVGALFFGMSVSFMIVLFPLFIKWVFGTHWFSKIYSIMLVPSSICSSLSISMYGYIFDKTGSYHTALMLCTTFALCSMALIVVVVLWRKKREY